MNEIEKLYKTAGIECKPNYIYNKVPILSGLKYPPFTAEKQLELIKWLASFDKYDQDRRLLMECCSGEWYIAFYKDLDLLSNAGGFSFKECLGRVINNLWQDLTEEEKEQIRGVLNG